MIKGMEKGHTYKLAYTKPMYDRHEHHYLPDNFRFCDPDIRRVSFGGRFDGGSRYCAVCGRKGEGSYQFLDLDSFKEFYLSDHCLRHESTTVWSDTESDDVIKRWYAREDIERRAKGGDPLAGLTLALEDWEDLDDS